MDKLIVKSNLGDYQVFFHNNLTFLDELKTYSPAVFIIDKKVYEIYKETFSSFPHEDIYLFEAIEQNKNFEAAFAMYDFILQKSAKRNLTLVSIGGGITQDVTGFVASTLYRGVKWIFVPTTFLAQTDSGIGSKTSLNYKNYKNLLGTFYPPRELHVSSIFLSTLDKLNFYSGVGKTIKFLLMDQTRAYDLNRMVSEVNDAIKSPILLNEMIQRNMLVKISYMEGDEFDTGRRNLLNFGHCFGHALETSSEYYVPHGIAVSIGMIFANYLSAQRGFLSNEQVESLNLKLISPNIPLAMRADDFDQKKLLAAMKNDKKRVGAELAVVLLDSDMTLIKVTDVTETEFNNILQKVRELFFKE